MRTFSETPNTRHRHGHRPAAAVLARLRGLDSRGQDGFLLIEVMISALLVALIVTATFNGLSVANRLTSDQRTRGQAALLAAQSQEQLRSEPASALDVLETSPHKYTTKVGGTTYTITQQAKAVSATGNTTGCSATETTAQTGANILITSSVSWARQVSSHRPEVKQTSVISPPTGSAIEVDVLNGTNEGVEGVTARAEFIPNEAGSYNTVEGTTSSAGCVVLTGIQATSAKVYIVEKAGYVTPTGALSVKPKELTIAPNITTHYAVQYAEAGRIEAKFTYEGATSYLSKEVKSDTFVAFNTETGIKPEYELGSTAFQWKAELEEPYLAKTGTYAASAATAIGSKYPTGRLFDFKGPWTVYAGDCPANKVTTAAATVTEGATTKVNVPVSYTKMSVYTGIASGYEPGEPDKEAIKETGKNVVKITDSSCAGAEEPLNAYGAVYTHEQKETLTEGRLENPFQPFGTFSVCLYEPKQKRTYTTSYTNAKAVGGTPTIYLKQKTAEEQTAEETEENTAKSERVTEENEAKAAETERKAVEKGESKFYWEKLGATPTQLKEKERTKATLEKELSKSARETAEKTPETKAYWERQKSKGEITATQLTFKEKTKATIVAENAAAPGEKTTRVNEEKAAEKAKATREKREGYEEANKVTVEGSKTSC